MTYALNFARQNAVSLSAVVLAVLLGIAVLAIPVSNSVNSNSGGTGYSVPGTNGPNYGYPTNTPIGVLPSNP